MPKCPNCGKGIEYLNHFQSGETKYEFSVDQGDPCYEEEEFIANNETNDYECPECHKVLFTDEEKATEFLKSYDEDKALAKEASKKVMAQVQKAYDEARTQAEKALDEATAQAEKLPE